MVINEKKVTASENGKEIGRFIPKDTAVSYLTDSLTGILKGNHNLDAERDSVLRKKYKKID